MLKLAIPCAVKQRWQTRGSLFTVSALSFVAFMVSNVANYGTQVCLGRLLGPQAYGAYNALTAILMLLALPISALAYIFTRTVAQYHVRQQPQWIRYYYHQSFARLLMLGLSLCLLVFFAQAWLNDFLHIHHTRAAVWLGPATFAALFFPLNLAFIQGLQNFRWVTLLSAFAGPARFMCSVLIVWLGFGVSGALFAIFLYGMLCGLLSLLPLWQLIRPGVSPPLEQLPQKDDWSDAVAVFISTAAFFVLTQCDVILVKHLFAAKLSGYYASAALMGKAVLYVPGAVIVGLIPMTAGQANAAARRILKKALLITSALSGLGALGFFCLPRWILQTFFGRNYLPAAELLQYFGVAMLPMAFILILKAYFIARKSNLFSYTMLFGAGGMLGCMVCCSTTPMDVIAWMGLWGTAIMVAGFMIEFLTVRAWRVSGVAKGVQG